MELKWLLKTFRKTFDNEKRTYLVQHSDDKHNIGTTQWNYRTVQFVYT